MRTARQQSDLAEFAQVPGRRARDETVVVAGRLKLRNNIAVLVNNSVLPTDDAHPRPTDQ